MLANVTFESKFIKLMLVCFSGQTLIHEWTLERIIEAFENQVTNILCIRFKYEMMPLNVNIMVYSYFKILSS